MPSASVDIRPSPNLFIVTFAIVQSYSMLMCCSVDKYKDHFSFLRDNKFLQELENDSVDSELIEQELSALHQVPIR